MFHKIFLWSRKFLHSPKPKLFKQKMELRVWSWGKGVLKLFEKIWHLYFEKLNVFHGLEKIDFPWVFKKHRISNPRNTFSFLKLKPVSPIVRGLISPKLQMSEMFSEILYSILLSQFLWKHTKSQNFSEWRNICDCKKPDRLK